jgi:site-specific DNA-cytosine methylase
VPRHIEESQSAWKKATETVGGSVAYTKSRRAQSVDDYETWIENVVNPTLNQFDQGDIRTTTAITQLVLFENSYRDGARIAKEQITQTLSAKMGTGGGNTPMVAYSVREDVKNKNFSATPIDQSLALQTMRMSPSSHHAQTVINQNTVVRRLTPLECERLMGWPDDWTAGQSDTHRYKQCGNGVASPVAQWIAQQLLKLNTP